MSVSVIVPVFNEAASLDALCAKLLDVLGAQGGAFEVVLVDDGSTDGSRALARALAARDPRLRVLSLRGNFGKSAALAAGFDHSTGDAVITMDADLQDDPEEIPRFLEALQTADVVSGYKRRRHDPWNKVLGSRVFNGLTRALTGLRLHDVNCGYKGYRRSVVRELACYGDFHRLLPVLAAARRFRVTEIEVRHHPRPHGRSKYGPGRAYRGVMDLMTVVFLTRYAERPAHLFGLVGVGSTGLGLSISLYMTALWFLGRRPIGTRPLFFLGILLLIVGVQFFATGLLAQLLAHMAQQQGKPYALAEESESP